MATKILVGHVLDRLSDLPAESVHCCVTSPPYYGLRDYGIAPQVWGGEPGCQHAYGAELFRQKGGAGQNKGLRNADGYRQARDTEAQLLKQGVVCLRCGAWRGSLGLEPSVALYVEHIVAVFREVRRVLRRDGTCWLNIGDSYAGSWGAQSRRVTKSDNPSWHGSQIKNHPKRASNTGSIRDCGLKRKDLIGVPWRVAFALQDDGWWVRSEIVWAKRAPMPESVTDRPTSAHEKVFLLAKSASYFYDAEAVKEDFADERMGNPGSYCKTSARSKGYTNDRQDGGFLNEGGGWNADGAVTGRNMRNVWWLNPERFPEAHFATFPTEIPRRAILAGTSAKGVCAVCGAPWTRVTKTCRTRDGEPLAGSWKTDAQKIGPSGVGHWRDKSESETIGWRAACDCGGAPVPATVLDPFLGSGTTTLVADRLGRDCIGIELSPKYAAMAERRIAYDAGMFAEVSAQ